MGKTTSGELQSWRCLESQHEAEELSPYGNPMDQGGEADKLTSWTWGGAATCICKRARGYRKQCRIISQRITMGLHELFRCISDFSIAEPNVDKMKSWSG